MDDKPLIQKIELQDILSFGNRGEEIKLQPLNVLIGQNGSGKSNLVDIVKLLRSLPQDRGLVDFISRMGGISEWMWKGAKSKEIASINIEMTWLDGSINYQLSFSEKSQRVFIQEERFFNVNKVELFQEVYAFERRSQENTLISDSSLNFPGSKAEFVFFRNVLLRSVFVYTDLQTNRSSGIRKTQVPDAPNDFLMEDGSNLSLVLNDFEHRGKVKDIVIEYLKKFNPRISNYTIKISGGTVQLFIHEDGLEKPISAMRISDGTLRYLCILAILCHPEPPQLICIEEPETGLHPDILPTIAELLIKASKRTQLIVTTHSDILVSALSDTPEAILICEKGEDGTHLKRLDKESLKVWLEDYSLGEVWLQGKIGGVRW